MGVKVHAEPRFLCPADDSRGPDMVNRSGSDAASILDPREESSHTARFLGARHSPPTLTTLPRHRPASLLC
jgi:hypothetical protein